jgi:hypothetical protein
VVSGGFGRDREKLVPMLQAINGSKQGKISQNRGHG